MIKSPCTPDCPERKCGCHAKCNKYKVYEAMRNRGYEKRQEEQRTEVFMQSIYTYRCNFTDNFNIHKIRGR